MIASLFNDGIAAGTETASFAASRNLPYCQRRCGMFLRLFCYSSKDIVDGPVVVVKNETTTSRPKKNRKFVSTDSVEICPIL